MLRLFSVCFCLHLCLCLSLSLSLCPSITWRFHDLVYLALLLRTDYPKRKIVFLRSHCRTRGQLEFSRPFTVSSYMRWVSVSVYWLRRCALLFVCMLRCCTPFFACYVYLFMCVIYIPRCYAYYTCVIGFIIDSQLWTFLRLNQYAFAICLLKPGTVSDQPWYFGSLSVYSFYQKRKNELDELIVLSISTTTASERTTDTKFCYAKLF